MATAPSLPLVTEDEYFGTGLWNEWEYDNGVLGSRNSGSRDHARMVMRLGQLLGRFEAITAFAAFVLSVTARGTYRVPDVCCYPADVDPGDSLENQPPPLAIFEVLSKTDPMSEMQKKCDEYRRLGVPHIFIVDPQQQVVLVPERGGFPAVSEEMSFEHQGQKISIPLADLFAGFAPTS